MRQPDAIITTMASALIQWQMRTQTGWIVLRLFATVMSAVIAPAPLCLVGDSYGPRAALDAHCCYRADL
jgi:hypothetical protein